MQVKPSATVAQTVELDDNNVGTPVLNVQLTAALSREELTAALFMGAYGPEDIESPAFVRELVASVLLGDGLAAVQQQAEKLDELRADIQTRAWLARCGRQVGKAFGLDAPAPAPRRSRRPVRRTAPVPVPVLV